MIIEIHAQGKKKKYYLAHSFRDGKKVKKIRRYLGADLSEDQLRKLRGRAEEIIREQVNVYKSIADPLKHVLTEKELDFMRQLEAMGHIDINHLSEEGWKQFTESFTYNTNAIEGSTVNQAEVKEILEQDIWPRDIPKEDISEIYGVATAIEHIRKTKEHISLELIKKLHSIVFKNSKTFAGQFRKKGIEVVIRDASGNIVHHGAPANRIIGLLKELIAWYQKHKRRYPPILLAAVLHNQFENIHPFQDGNGRVGRLLLNNVLLKHNLPPVNIHLKNRREYYKALQAYQNEGNIRPTIGLILKEYREWKKEWK
ncbi:Fic family protein [Candidatus Woesearchaeota archaeon]|nr:Fic family protein [Candidatus Woesearchaeota archaeon]